MGRFETGIVATNGNQAGSPALFVLAHSPGNLPRQLMLQRAEVTIRRDLCGQMFPRIRLPSPVPT